MEWLNVTAEAGLGGLFLSSFLASTVLPGGSEAIFWGFLRLHPEQLQAALALATLGNTAGGMSSWWCGRYLPRWQRLAELPFRSVVSRWGSLPLLFSWLPLVGDGLCVVAGWLGLHWLPCLLLMAVGKFCRYWLIAQVA